MYLLDTNICIDFVDGRSPVARKRVRSAFSTGLQVSTVTAAELLVGPRESDDPDGDRENIERFLAVMQVRDFDSDAARTYAELVQRVGVKRRSFDRLIGAHALALGLILVTNNEADFNDIPGLRVENWARA